jgi:hypothetical protein
VQANDEELNAPHPLRVAVGDPQALSDDELAAILDLPELGLLAPEPDAVSALDAALGEIAASPPAPERVAAAVEERILALVDQFLTPTVRARLSERFLELGLLLLGRGGDLAAARACVVAADRAADPSVAPHRHPLLVGMFRRLVPGDFALKLIDR